MTRPQTMSFSDRTLVAAEHAQYAARNTRMVRIGERILTGSNSAAYKQLLWLPPSQMKSAEVRDSVHVYGDLGASKWARLWKNIAVLTVPTQVMDQMRSDLPEAQQAIAYKSDKIVHVGILTSHEDIMRGIPGDAQAVAVRIGRGPTEFVIGRYNSAEKSFVSTPQNSVEVLETYLPIEDIHEKYPCVNVV